MIKERQIDLPALDISTAEPFTEPDRRRLRLPKHGWLAGTTIFAGALALYLATWTHLNTFDAVSYAGLIAIHANAPGSTVGWMFHPHHLLFNAVGYAFWHLAQLCGSQATSLSLLQAMNSVLGALGLVIFYATLRRILPRDPWLCRLATIGLATSFGYWICATDGRVNMPSLVLLLAAFAVLVRLIEQPTRALAVALGLVSGVAVLFHESAGLFGPVGLAGVLLARGADHTVELSTLSCEESASRSRDARKAMLVRITLYLTAFVGMIAIPYLVVGCGLLGLRSVAGFRHWANSYAELGWWWNFHIASDLKQDLYALRHALFVEPGGTGTIHLPANVPWLLRLAYYSALCGWVLAGLFLLRSLPRLWRSGRRPIVIVCLLWTILYAAFFTVWSPGYFVFWVPALVPLAVLLVLSISSLPRRNGFWVRLLLADWLILCAVVNWCCSIGPYHMPNASPFQRIAKDIRAHTKPGDLIVVMGAGSDAQCEVDIPYFADRNLLSLHSTLTGARDNVPATVIVARAKIAHTLGLRNDVYALNDVLDDPPAFNALHTKHPAFTQADLESLVGVYRWAPAWKGPRGEVWRLAGAAPTPPQPGLSTAR